MATNNPILMNHATLCAESQSALMAEGMTNDEECAVYNVSQALCQDYSLTDEETGLILATLRRNVQNGRAQKVMTRLHPLVTPHQTCSFVNRAISCWNSWRAYQTLVLHTYQSQRERLQALCDKESMEWGRLAQELAHSATATLCRWGMGYPAAKDRGWDAAQQACEHICKAAFPCDIPFDCWAHAILRNVILQIMTRSQDLLDRHPHLASIDELDELDVHSASDLRPYADSHSDSEEMSSLIAAIKRLKSENRRQVLIYTYFDDLDDAEIAAAMGRTVGVIHTLRHRAVQQLRNYLIGGEAHGPQG